MSGLTDRELLRRLAHDASENEMGWLEPKNLRKIMVEDWVTYIIKATPNAIIELIDELEACKADAERYRWLKEGCDNDPENLGVEYGPSPGVDAAIDHARGVGGKYG